MHCTDCTVPFFIILSIVDLFAASSQKHGLAFYFVSAEYDAHNQEYVIPKACPSSIAVPFVVVINILPVVLSEQSHSEVIHRTLVVRGVDKIYGPHISTHVLRP